jgi:transcriptional regulator with XRE-family HTH domain
MGVDLKVQIGARLRAIRTARGLTQEQVAALIERSTETVSNIERGTTLVGLDTLSKISHGLKVPISEFIPETSNNRPRATDIRLRDIARTLSDHDAAMLLNIAEVILRARQEGRRASRNKG